jgi:hypothetical protein
MTHDAVTGADEAAYKAAYVTIIDALHAKDDDAKIYLASPWKRGFDTSAALWKSWNADLVALYPGICVVGVDESIVIKGSDDGATMTVDGIHYSVSGSAAMSAAWKAIIQP